MAFPIKDGTGDGFLAEVDSDKRLHTKAVTETKEHTINEESGKVWTIPFEGLNPAGADDYVVYIKNTGDAGLEIPTIRVSADTAITQVELHAVTGTVAGGGPPLRPSPAPSGLVLLHPRRSKTVRTSPVLRRPGLWRSSNVPWSTRSTN